MFFFLFYLYQVVNLMKPIVAASSHVVGNKDVDKGEDFYGHMQNNLSDCMLKFPWINLVTQSSDVS